LGFFCFTAVALIEVARKVSAGESVREMQAMTALCSIFRTPNFQNAN